MNAERLIYPTVCDRITETRVMTAGACQGPYTLDGLRRLTSAWVPKERCSQSERSPLSLRDPRSGDAWLWHPSTHGVRASALQESDAYQMREDIHAQMLQRERLLL
jgi:hypothetical protein